MIKEPLDIIATMTKDRVVRRAISEGSFEYFFAFYYAHYIKYPTASFQKEIMGYLQNNINEDLFVVAFRGSGKSTLITTAYPIWSILGIQKKRFCLILCQTRTQAKQHMKNIRSELENNQLLRKDLGPFEEESDEWGSYSIVFAKHGARITLASSEQSIRGIRHNEHRPDLIICDDVEDISSTRTKEARDKTYKWLFGEIIPAGDKNTRLIIVGNLLHEDSLLMRIKRDIQDKKRLGIFKEYPLLDDRDQCLWIGKYPTMESIEEEKKKIVSDSFWQREYLLRIIPEDDQVIHADWIQYYDELPNRSTRTRIRYSHPSVYSDGDYFECRFLCAGVDLAISQKETADCTGIVIGMVCGWNENLKIFIYPNPVNKRLEFPAQVDLIKDIQSTVLSQGEDIIVIENVAYQEALPQMLRSMGLNNIETEAPRSDKRTRLTLTSSHIKNGTILFPKEGCEELIQQLVGFGVERHDDLADAFSLLISYILQNHANRCPLFFA